MNVFRSSEARPRRRNGTAHSGALRLGGLYLLLGAAWIVFSDRAVEAWVTDPGLRSSVQTVKGVAFVLGSAAVVAALVWRELRVRKEVEERQRTVIDQNLAGLYVIVGSRFSFVNGRMAEIFGYTPAELVSEVSVPAVVAPEDRDTVAENLRRRLRGEVESVHYEFDGLRKDGTRIRVEVHGRAVEWRGEPAVMGVLLDVTERQRLRTQARQTQRLELLGELTGSVAHDINNLLTAIIAPLELCRVHLGPDHPARQEVDEAHWSANRAKTLIRHLLSFSRQRLHRPRPVDLNGLVGEMEPMLSRLTGPGVRLRLDLAGRLPAVRVDPSNMEQVILNLVTNAAHAVGDRGEILVRTRTAPGDAGVPPRVVLEVSDQGVGMDEETLGQIFEPFFTTRKDGTGLGLATVHGIVTQAGGDLSVDSRPGDGSTFTIRFPGTDEPAVPATDEEDEEPEVRVVARDAKILLVDDEPAVLRVTARALERYGLRSIPASSGQEALAVAGEHSGDIGLVLTDVGLPDLDGLELASRLRDLLPDVPVIFMSGFSDRKVLDRLARQEHARFLEKPFSVRELVGAVTAALEGGGQAGARAG